MFKDPIVVVSVLLPASGKSSKMLFLWPYTNDVLTVWENGSSIPEEAFPAAVGLESCHLHTQDDEIQI